MYSSQGGVCEDNHNVVESYESPPAAEDTPHCTEADLTRQLQADEDLSRRQLTASQRMKSDNAAARAHLPTYVMQQTRNHRDMSADIKHNPRASCHTSTASANGSQTYTDNWIADSDCSLSLASIAASFTSHGNVAENEKASSHLQSSVYVLQNTVPDVEVVNGAPALGTTKMSRAPAGCDEWDRMSSSRQTCVSDTSDVDTGRMIKTLSSRPHVNTATESRPGRGRGLMNLRQLQAAKMKTPSKSRASASAEVSGGGSAHVLYRAVTPPGMRSPESLTNHAIDSLSSRVQQSAVDRHAAVSGSSLGEVQETGLSGGCQITASNSDDGSEGFAVNGDPRASSSVHSSVSSGGSSRPSIIESASLPATGPPPLPSYLPHAMPFSWPQPPPLCGLVPPGFAPAPVPVVGQTLPVPYSSLPLYPGYGYQMISPGSWPILPSVFGSLPPEESNDNVDKVD